jgi:hypothetical protein
MCTVLFHSQLGLLSKNRDKPGAIDEEVVNEPNRYLAVRTKGASYFSLGVNRFGVGFVSTAINSPEWTRACESGNLDRAKEIYANENKGLRSPTLIVSENFETLRSIESLKELLEKNSSYIGYHVVFAQIGADHQARGYVAELRDQQKNIRPLRSIDAITNHFLNLDFGPKNHVDYRSTFNRLAYCESRLHSIHDRSEFESTLAKTSGDPDQQIWRTEGAFHTVSSTLLNLKDQSIERKTSRAEPYRKSMATPPLERGGNLWELT